MKKSSRYIISACSVAILFLVMAAVLIYTYVKVPGTYENTTDVKALYDNPTDYDTEGAQGIAEIIVKENLDKTNAVNDVASVVYDFRGFDTLGESFILLTAIAGTYVVLSPKVNLKRKGKEEAKK